MKQLRQLLLSVTAILFFTAALSANEKPKNIVLILADDLGWADTTLYGKTSLYETPNIQRLASQGMTFSNAYASPICSPTRASILTGQNPARLGLTTPSAHLKEERLEAVSSPRALPHQKSTNVQSTTRIDLSLPTLSVPCPFDPPTSSRPCPSTIPLIWPALSWKPKRSAANSNAS